MRRFLSVIMLSAGMLAIAACATDGGIDGTGNRVDCKAQPTHEQCKRDGTSKLPGSY
jgi:hypothetical protein